MTILILAEIATLKRMPVLAEKLKNFKPPEPSDTQKEMERLAIEKASLENEVLKSEIELNKAKAEEALSKKDKNNLDYVEQETGTEHERAMQKQRAQSQGNQNLAVTKALTTARKEGEKAPNIEAAVGFNQISDRLADAGTLDPKIPEESVQQPAPMATDPMTGQPIY